MGDTKEAILHTALRLFAKDGYEAVPVSAIAGELGMTKGALYRHYGSKRDIFESILKRMERMDGERAAEYDMPGGTAEESPEAYEDTEFENIRAFTLAQFDYWTREEFSSNFRKLLTLEQYRDAEMSKLYRIYIAAGPLEYIEALFEAVLNDKASAKRLALEFYAPVFLLYSVYDGSEEKEAARTALCAHLDRFGEKMRKGL